MRDRLARYNTIQVNAYCDYVIKLQTQQKPKTSNLQNPWAVKIQLDQWIAYFEQVAITGFYIDGVDITINNHGISLNYHAYKKLVLRKYPEATFDMQLIKEGDEFSFTKDNGKVNYTHKITDPFGTNKVIGGYCIIKLMTGEFLELLSREDLEQIRRTAKTDYIWKQWTHEMYLKTIMKRACKRHFRDETGILDQMDMVNYELPIAEDGTNNKITDQIKECTTSDELTKLWHDIKSDQRTKEQTTAIIRACASRKKEIGGENANP